jgi:NAD(P)-dependent dehydrogenase (short-subunit alcohol dehydrogenase family)
MASPPARTALVTGASRGIGREIGVALAQAGLKVALFATNTHAIEQLASELRKDTCVAENVIAIPCDVANPVEVTKATSKALAAFGHIDLLVNAAGVLDDEVPAWEANAQQWWHTFEVNVRGPFLLAQALVPQMIARGGGRIIDLSSGAATRPMVEASAYNASKTALLRFGEHLAVAGAEYGLRVFELAPGVVKTDMTADTKMHLGRTQWTPVSRTTDMVLAIARGEVDQCSGWYLRVTDDTPESLQTLAAQRTITGPNSSARKLRIMPAPKNDPLTG